MIFRQVFRIAFITLIWKQYKAWIVSSLLLLLSLYLISAIHADFLLHWELQSDNSKTGMSFLYKWLAYVGCIVLYCLYHFLRPKKKVDQQKLNKEKQTALNDELKNLSNEEDPFRTIRTRDKLRSRSDFILEKEKQDK